MSRQRDFHMQMHERFRKLRSGIPAGLVVDSTHLGAMGLFTIEGVGRVGASIAG